YGSRDDAGHAQREEHAQEPSPRSGAETSRGAKNRVVDAAHRRDEREHHVGEEDLNHTDEDAERRADEGERLVDDAHAHEYTVDHSGILEEPHPGEATDEQARPER